MPEQTPDRLLGIYLQEFDKLKSEQTNRIGFRDNIIYVTLIAIGSIVSFAIGDEDRIDALLILPWVSFIMGWMYLDNDLKISALGEYFRDTLATHIRMAIPVPPDHKAIMGWEYANHEDPDRKARKRFQFLVNMVTFCLSGGAALVAYYMQNQHPSLPIIAVMVVEALLMIILSWQFVKHSDLLK